jgi:hypothetical protein
VLLVVISLLVFLIITVPAVVLAIEAFTRGLTDTSVRENRQLGLGILLACAVLALLFSVALLVIAVLIRPARKGVCPKCGYDLRGQVPGAARCPECGWERASEHAERGDAV